MKVLIDPLLFAVPPAGTAGVIAETDKQDLLNRLAFLVALFKRGFELVTTRSVWTRIENEIISQTRDLVEHHRLNPGLSIIRRGLRYTEPVGIGGQTWQMAPLFSNYPDPSGWMTPLAQVAAQWIHDGEAVIFAIRSMVGRNLQPHASGNSVLYEKNIWQIYIQTNPGTSPFLVECVSSLRNVDVEWTRRYDDSLPDTAPNEGLRFLPPQNWRAESHQIIRTMLGKPAWIDLGGNGWCDPDTPGISHHWDVHLNEPVALRRFKLSPINITKHGTTDRDTDPGSVHHIPKVKLSRIGIGGI